MGWSQLLRKRRRIWRERLIKVYNELLYHKRRGLDLCDPALRVYLFDYLLFVRRRFLFLSFADYAMIDIIIATCVDMPCAVIIRNAHFQQAKHTRLCICRENIEVVL